MEAQERKEKFTALLNQLLLQCEGIKGNLAAKLGIKPSTLTPWLQGKIDPASLEILVFERIAKTAQLSTDLLAQELGITETEKQQKIPQERLKVLIEQMLSAQSQEKLGKRLGISQNTVSNWINPEKDIDPGKLPVSTISSIAKERGWTIERLLSYLLLKNKKEVEEDILIFIQTRATQLSFPNQLKLLNSLSSNFEKQFSIFYQEISSTHNQKILSDKKSLMILEKEDLAVASRYMANLIVHAQINSDNIEVATIFKLPDTLQKFDLLIFNIESNDPYVLHFINQISFNGDIVIFTQHDLEKEVRSQLQDKVTDIVVKPLDWDSLKDKPYFTST